MEFDHLVIVVPNLEVAARKFEKAGFTVSPGGTHFAGISKNKLIFFENNTFIELLKIRNSIGGLAIKFLYYTNLHNLLSNSKMVGLPYRFYIKALERSVGLYDFCFLAKDLKYEENRLKKHGIKMSAIISAGRVRPNGNILKWKMSTPISSHLPFLRDHFIADLPTSKTVNVIHQNGIVGIKSISCTVQNLSQKATDIIAFYGVDNCLKSENRIVVKMPKIELIYLEKHRSVGVTKTDQNDNEIDFAIDFNFDNKVSSIDNSLIVEYISIADKNK
jgi:hypothetical protein